MTPPARSHLQYSDLGISASPDATGQPQDLGISASSDATGQPQDLGISALPDATGQPQEDGEESSIQAISGSLSDLSLSKYAVSQMSTSPVTDDELKKEFDKGFDHRTLRKLRLSSQDIKVLQKRYVIAESVSPAVALKKINDALSKWDEKEGKYKLRMPGSGSDLYVYDETLGQICRRRKKPYLVARQKSLRLGELLSISKGLLESDTFKRLRLIHYMYPQLCRGTTAASSMDLLHATAGELSIMLEVSRESLNLMSSPRGYTVGPAILCVGKKELVDCNHGGATGNLIPCEIETIDKINPTDGVQIEYVLLVEKDTIFHYLAGRNFHKKNKCMLITGKGMPDMYTRILLRKYNDLLGVPIYALMDGNPSGAVIFSTYCSGSEEKAAENLFLTVPRLDFIGLFVRDVLEENRSELTADDQSKLSNLLNKTYVDRIPALRDNLTYMHHTNSKADIEMMMRQQSLESYILRYVDEAVNRTEE